MPTQLENALAASLYDTDTPSTNGKNFLHYLQEDPGFEVAPHLPLSASAARLRRWEGGLVFGWPCGLKSAARLRGWGGYWFFGSRAD